MFSAAADSDADDSKLESVDADVLLTAPIDSVAAVAETVIESIHLKVWHNSPFDIEPSTFRPFVLSVHCSENFQMCPTVRTVLLRFGVKSLCTVLPGSKVYLQSPDTGIPR